MRHPHLPKTARARRGLAAAAALCAAFALTSCTIGPLSIGTITLPHLSPSDTARELAARTEAAGAARARDLLSGVGECSQCRAALESVEADSLQREATLGGVWQPWANGRPDLAEDVPDIADAPVDVEAFTTWLAHTAQRDLALASNPDVLSGEAATTLAGVALGRYSSAIALAHAYDIDVEGASARVSELIARLDFLSDADALSQLDTWAFDLDNTSAAGVLPLPDFSAPSAAPEAGPGSEAGEQAEADSNAAAARDIASSAELSSAIATWDCVAQSLPKAALIEGAIFNPTTAADTLFHRANTLISAGATDQRTTRCELGIHDLASISRSLINADISLIASDDAQIRLLGANLALEDLRYLTSINALTPQAFIGVEVPSAGS